MLRMTASHSHIFSIYPQLPAKRGAGIFMSRFDSQLFQYRSASKSPSLNYVGNICRPSRRFVHSYPLQSNMSMHHNITRISRQNRHIVPLMNRSSGWTLTQAYMRPMGTANFPLSGGRSVTQKAKKKKNDNEEDTNFDMKGFFTWDFQLLWKRSKEFGIRLYKGLRDLISSTKEANKLRRKRREGEQLSRREYRFLRQNTTDLYRLIPLLVVWKGIPFSGFALPFVLVKYPHFFPSTFRLALFRSSVEDERTRRNNARLEQLREHSLDTYENFKLVSSKIKSVNPIEIKDIQNNTELLSASFSLDDLKWTQLTMLATELGLGSGLGLAVRLRSIIQNHADYLVEDDEFIYEEGIESLSDAEVKEACLERGLSFKKEDNMSGQLRAWIKLSREHADVIVPLLIFVHSFQVRPFSLRY